MGVAMILGIESSCDESALAVFDPLTGLSLEKVSSQVTLHSRYGGVVPDLASREHVGAFTELLNEVGSDLPIAAIREIAVTVGPGLAGCLAVGMGLGQALSLAWKIPLKAINHLRGHAWSPFIDLHEKSPEAFDVAIVSHLPHLGLIVSGGNSVLFEISPQRQITVLAQTVDDAAGEALDKGAKLLGLPYPGGPLIEAKGANGDPAAYPFPDGLTDPNDLRFSFSGLKTSLRYRLEKMTDAEVAEALPDLCASYQAAVVRQLLRKTRHALRGRRFRSLGLSGGVANNQALRNAFGELAAERELPVWIARRSHTGDNAGMIAFTAWADPQARQAPFELDPSLPLTNSIAAG